MGRGAVTTMGAERSGGPGEGAASLTTMGLERSVQGVGRYLGDLSRAAKPTTMGIELYPPCRDPIVPS